MHAWIRISILLTFQSFVEGGNANNLILVIAQSLMQQGVLIHEEITKRLICFGVDGASFFPRLLHWSDISIGRKICYLHDGTTLHGP
jgi:hypothetical protein